MKKILTVSLGALLIVGAANAEIASVDYVDDVAASKQNASTIGTVTAANMGTTAATVVGAISEVAGEAAAAQTTATAAQTTATAAQTAANTASTTATAANNAIAAMDLATVGGTTSVVRSVTQTNGVVTATAEAVDTVPVSESTKLITSGGVYSGLSKKVNIRQNIAEAGKGLVVDGTNGTLVLTDIATQEELDRVASTASSGQTATQVNTAITNAINNLDVASVGETGKFIITIKQENGKIEAATKDFVPTLSDGELNAPTTDAVYDALALKQNKLSFTPENTDNRVSSVTSASTDSQYPSAKAVYTALSSKQNSLGYTAENAANKVSSVSSTSTDTQYPSAKAVYTAVSGKQNSSLGSTAANKAVITDASGNITSGTITSAMITDATIATGDIANSAVTTAKIADGTITNADISASAAIAQSKISGLTTALGGKQDAAPRDESGNAYFVASPDGRWKDMFSAMPKDRECERDGVKCALTHKSGAYAWEIVRE